MKNLSKKRLAIIFSIAVLLILSIIAVWSYTHRERPTMTYDEAMTMFENERDTLELIANYILIDVKKSVDWGIKKVRNGSMYDYYGDVIEINNEPIKQAVEYLYNKYNIYYISSSGKMVVQFNYTDNESFSYYIEEVPENNSRSSEDFYKKIDDHWCWSFFAGV